MTHHVIPFEPDAVKAYLDLCIKQHRRRREGAWLNKDLDRWKAAQAAVDAFQSVRASLFGETLPEEESGHG